MSVVNQFFALLLGEIPNDPLELILLDLASDILENVEVIGYDVDFFFANGPHRKESFKQINGITTPHVGHF
jgi:hypothetical protein